VDAVRDSAPLIEDADEPIVRVRHRHQQGRTLGRACIVDRPHLEGQGHERLLDVALPIVVPDANVDAIPQLI
jgi:hypothetical protein